MTRRQAAGLVLLFLLLTGGRLLRDRLMAGPDGAWREPGFLDSLLPPLPEAEAPPPPPPTGPFAVNTAPVDTLVFLPGVGPVLAGRIVAEREAGGPFRDLDDLRRVKGIGPRLAVRIAEHVVFGAGGGATMECPQDTAQVPP